MIISCKSVDILTPLSAVLTHEQQYRGSPFQTAKMSTQLALATNHCNVSLLCLGIKAVKQQSSMGAPIFRILSDANGIVVLEINVYSPCILYQDTHISFSSYKIWEMGISGMSLPNRI